MNGYSGWSASVPGRDAQVIPDETVLSPVVHYRLRRRRLEKVALLSKIFDVTPFEILLALERYFSSEEGSGAGGDVTEGALNSLQELMAARNLLGLRLEETISLYDPGVSTRVRGMTGAEEPSLYDRVFVLPLSSAGGSSPFSQDLFPWPQAPDLTAEYFESAGGEGLVGRIGHEFRGFKRRDSSGDLCAAVGTWSRRLRGLRRSVAT